MKFIQSVKTDNLLINLDLVLFIEMQQGGITFGFSPDEIIYWNYEKGDEEKLKEDYKNLLSVLNADVSSLHTIK